MLENSHLEFARNLPSKVPGKAVHGEVSPQKHCTTKLHKRGLVAGGEGNGEVGGRRGGDGSRVLLAGYFWQLCAAEPAAEAGCIAGASQAAEQNSFLLQCLSSTLY